MTMKITPPSGFWTYGVIYLFDENVVYKKKLIY
jgi:hypothetical protein